MNCQKMKSIQFRTRKRTRTLQGSLAAVWLGTLAQHGSDELSAHGFSILTRKGVTKLTCPMAREEKDEGPFDVFI